MATELKPQRRAGTRYVVVVHKQSGRAFSLDGCYALLEHDVSADVVAEARKTHADEWDAWCPPTIARPEWTKSLDPDAFIAYWVL